MASKEPLNDDGKLVQRWIDEIDLAERGCAAWWRSGDVIIRRYKNEVRNGRGGANAATDPIRRFAILWSNVQTLAPAIYAKRPVPEVSRRFNDPDPVGKVAADVLERALAYSLEAYDFDGRIGLCRNDYLLSGRGQLWIRYVPHIREVSQGDVDKDEGEPDATVAEEVEYEEVVCDHVAWKDFLTNPTREWSETRWVARRVFMTRGELVKRFGALGKRIPLDAGVRPQDDGPADDGDGDRSKKAQVYELWDKVSQCAYWVSKSFTERVLDKRPDPLGLKDFFPCPPPLNATTGPDSTIPVPDYVQYQDQAEELDDLTQRIGGLQKALRMVGVYAGEENVTLQNLFTPGNENTLIPVDAYDLFKDKGGIKGLIEWVPIDMVIQCLRGCYEARAQVISDIYQITGLSDIIRGDSDPNETATAQGIKAQWGSLRVRDRQKEVQRFARDAIAIKAEIIGEHFSVETLRAMTNVKLMTDAEKQAAQMQMQQQAIIWQGQVRAAQMQGMEPPPQPQPDPEVMELLQQPSWDQVMNLLKNDAMRSFRIDIETDSTIEPNETEAKAAFTEAVTAATSLLTAAAPIVAAQPQTAEMFGEMMKELARVFRMSRKMEDVIEKTFSNLAQMPPAQPEAAPMPDPNVARAEEIKGQTAMIQAQSEQQRTQMDGQIAQIDAAVKMRELAVKEQALIRDPNPQASA